MLGDIEKPFYVQNERHVSIWLPGEGSPYLVRHLIEPVRRVIGLWQHPGLSIKQHAEIAGLYPGEFIAMNRMLCDSELAVIRFCKKFSMPASASVQVPRPFFCTECHSKICSLPCIRCWKGPDDDPFVK